MVTYSNPRIFNILTNSCNIVYTSAARSSQENWSVTRDPYANRDCNGNVTLSEKKIACGANGAFGPHGPEPVDFSPIQWI